MFTLRPYQAECVDACFRGWQDHTSLLVEMPTGTGKTVVFSEIARRWESGRVLVVCPAITLIGQAAKKICKMTGIMPDIEQAENVANETEWGRNPFVVASKQTLCKKKRSGQRRFERFSEIGLVIVDEAHLSITQEYADLLGHFRSQGAKVLGVTATPKRHDKRAMGQMYDTLAYQYGIVDAIEDGWLVSPVTECVQLKTLDLSGVKVVQTTHGKDFHEGELNARLESEETVYEISEVTARESGSLKTAVFCSSVNEAKLVAERLADCYRLKADWICADKRLCSDQHRREVLESFTDDPEGVQVVCNVGILTTGWDFPGLEHIVMARPTRSLSLYTQILGRGTRPLDGVVDFEGSDPASRIAAIAASAKPHFKVTDLVDAAMEHKIVTAVDVLGGKFSLEVQQKAKEIVAENHGMVVADALAEAERCIADALARAREEEERRKRAEIKARAEYDKVRVNPFDEHGVGVGVKKQKSIVMPWGKYKGSPLESLPIDYLKFALSNWDMKPYLRAAMNRIVSSREGGYRKPLDRINQLFQEV
jgi:superfamily II DNA or RNA helicase